MCKLRQEIRKWGDRTYSVINKINCPDHMAYWLADNIPITDVHKLQILSLHSSIQRLRLELHLIQNVSKSLSNLYALVGSCLSPVLHHLVTYLPCQSFKLT